jgi:hypothetical protein
VIICRWPAPGDVLNRVVGGAQHCVCHAGLGPQSLTLPVGIGDVGLIALAVELPFEDITDDVDSIQQEFVGNNERRQQPDDVA